MKIIMVLKDANVKKSSRTDDPLLDIFIEAGSQAGFPLTEDFNERARRLF